jgi:hypothetical protein
MTSAEITSIVEREISGFRLEAPAPGNGLLGTPWTADRIARGIEALRVALVDPFPIALTMQGVAAVSGHPAEAREAWVVAETNGLLVIFVPEASEFCLASACDPKEALDIGVRGDLVGTFLAA